jgi:hypothetical protein
MWKKGPRALRGPCKEVSSIEWDQDGSGPRGISGFVATGVARSVSPSAGQPVRLSWYP